MNRTRSMATGPDYNQCTSVNKDGTELVRGEYLSSQSLRTFSDTVVKNYRMRIARGEVINNECDLWDLKEENPTSGTMHTVNNSSGWWQTFSGSVLDYIQDSTDNYPKVEEVEPPIDTMTKETKLHALSKIDSTPYAFAEDLFEVSETVRFIRKPFQALHDMVSFHHRRRGRSKLRRKGVRQKVKETANAWTEYRFAAMPLIRSITDLTEAMLKPNEELPLRRSARGRRQVVTSGEKDSTLQYYTITAGLTYETDVRAHILYEWDNPIDEGWRRKYGLRTKDIPETLWNVVPLSFMVDRVINISQVISGLVNFLDPRLKILAASTTLRNKKVRTYTCSSASRSGWTYTVDSGTADRTEFSYERKIWIPTVADLVPTVNPMGLIDDVQKIADLAAIIIQRSKL